MITPFYIADRGSVSWIAPFDSDNTAEIQRKYKINGYIGRDCRLDKTDRELQIEYIKHLDIKMDLFMKTVLIFLQITCALSGKRNYCDQLLLR